MTTTPVATLSGGRTTLDDAMIEEFDSILRGHVISPADDRYEEARTVWNAMIDRRPALIVRCRGVADVIACVNLAREHELLTAVRGGGHNVAGNAVADEALVIDLSDMTSVRVDPVSETVRAEPGVRLGDMDREAQEFGLVVPSGIVTNTGVSGLTLGGGLGWLHRAWGLTCDHLLSCDVVTADGELVRASAEDNPDLFWALRGGGGNFGIVVSFEFQARRFGPTALAGLVIHPMDRGRELLDKYREFTADAPDSVTSFALLRRAPPAPFLPESWHGAPIAAFGACYAGPPEEGAELLEPLKSWGEPIADVLVPKPFVKHQAMLDAGQPPGGYYYWKSHFFDELTDPALDTMVERGRAITSPLSILALVHMAGAVARVGEDDTAYPNRAAPYVMNVNGSWKDPADTEVNLAWTRETWDALEPHANGARYANFEAGDRGSEIFGADKYRRLAAVKKRYDPANLFRLNQNIQPEA